MAACPARSGDRRAALGMPMVSPDPTALPDHRPAEAATADAPLTARPRALRTIVKVVELPLRFIALMVATGLVFGYWDTLVNLLEKWNRPPRTRPVAEGRYDYFCPMHPSVTGERAAQCPSCGMSLSRRLRGPGSVLPEGVLSRIRLEPGQVAQAGIRTAAVRFATPVERLTAVGFVGLDQSRRALVASDARGRRRVDRLHVSSEGEAVRAGQPLAELYGYDGAQAIQVFLDASRARRDGPEAMNTQRTPLGDPEERVRLADEGLKVLGGRQEQINAIASAEAPGDLLPLLAPIDGLIIRKDAVRGQSVTAGEVLFEVADLGRVWVEARIFEEDLGGVEVGGPVEATVPTYPGVVFAGEAALIGPTLDP